MMRACADCGEPTEAYGRCEDCTASPVAQAPGRHPSKSSTARGYGSAWRKLSERARRMQPWCSACGSHDDLTCDHSPEAWERYLAGKPIRLVDVDVLCRRCNAEKGRARPSAPRRATRGVGVTSGGPTRWGEAKFRSQMGIVVSNGPSRRDNKLPIPGRDNHMQGGCVHRFDSDWLSFNTLALVQEQGAPIDNKPRVLARVSDLDGRRRDRELAPSNLVHIMHARSIA